jgi:hypothetical protein
MNMIKFNAGDRVKVNDKCGNTAIHGQIGTVEDLYEYNGNYIILIVLDGENNRRSIVCTSLDMVKPAAVTVEFDDALNKAGWELLERIYALDVEVPAILFNNLKGCLKSAIEVYLTEKLK